MHTKEFVPIMDTNEKLQEVATEIPADCTAPTTLSDIEKQENSKDDRDKVKELIVNAFANRQNTTLNAICQEIANGHVELKPWTSWALIMKKANYIYDEFLKSTWSYFEYSINETYVCLVAEELQINVIQANMAKNVNDHFLKFHQEPLTGFAEQNKVPVIWKED